MCALAVFARAVCRSVCDHRSQCVQCAGPDWATGPEPQSWRLSSRRRGRPAKAAASRCELTTFERLMLGLVVGLGVVVLPRFWCETALTEEFFLLEQVGLAQMRGHTAVCSKYQEYIEEGVRTTAKSQPPIIRYTCFVYMYLFLCMHVIHFICYILCVCFICMSRNSCTWLFPTYSTFLFLCLSIHIFFLLMC